MAHYAGIGPLAKFLSLLVAVLLLATAIVCIFFGSILLAICSSVVSAYAAMLFFDALKLEMLHELRQSKDR
jgi:hypothetical protein